MKYSNIESIVRDHVTFHGSPSSHGWVSCYCAVCGDGSRTKGPRGGWLFHNDMVFYHCFNCPAEGTFDPHREFPFSKEMYNIFSSFGVPLKHCYGLIDNNVPTVVKRQPIKFDTIDIPDHFIKLCDATSSVAERALQHLIEKRRIDPYDYPFYVSTGHTKSKHQKDISMAKACSNRLIIPAFMNDKVIGYEAMALGNQSKKYFAVGTNLLHGYNNIFKYDVSVPLFITEGFFDSFYLNGVAVLTNNISANQIELLDKSNRLKIVVPDRKDTHNTLAEKAIDLNWGVSFPDIKPYKDVSEAVRHYGVLYVADSIMKNIKMGKSAQFCLKLFNL